MIITRAQLDADIMGFRVCWWWIKWCREWKFIGAAFAEHERLIRSLWERP
jgi:hypothetical protein